MTQHTPHQEIDTLRAEIIFQRARYNQSIKDGKVFRESRKVYEELKGLQEKLEQLEQLVRLQSK